MAFWSASDSVPEQSQIGKDWKSTYTFTVEEQPWNIVGVATHPDDVMMIWSKDSTRVSWVTPSGSWLASEDRQIWCQVMDIFYLPFPTGKKETSSMARDQVWNHIISVSHIISEALWNSWREPPPLHHVPRKNIGSSLDSRRIASIGMPRSGSHPNAWSQINEIKIRTHEIHKHSSKQPRRVNSNWTQIGLFLGRRWSSSFVWFESKQTFPWSQWHYPMSLKAVQSSKVSFGMNIPSTSVK